jgi:hypothetical protein
MDAKRRTCKSRLKKKSLNGKKLFTSRAGFTGEVAQASSGSKQKYEQVT